MQDNYQIQLEQAKKHFLTYDQQELIRRCRLRHDEDYFYVTMLSYEYRICRTTGHMERRRDGAWEDGNGFNEVMTLLDWLCDSRQDRYITGRWINPVTHGHYFHRDLEESRDPTAELFDAHPQAFCAACERLGGVKMSGADISYAIPFLDGLQVLVQLWHSDEEFPPNLRSLWDENVGRYLRYETIWFATALLMRRIQENMHM